MRKLAEFVEAQGGDANAVYDTTLLPQASVTKELLAQKDGYISRITCDEVGICSLILGGGRETKESKIDLAVGIVLKKKKGDAVKAGDVLAVLHANDEVKLSAALERLQKAYYITEEPPQASAFIKGIVE